MKVQATAHLLIHLQFPKTIDNGLKAPMPAVCGVGIYSSRDITVAIGTVVAEVYTTHGLTYGAAVARMYEVVKAVPAFAWMWPWLDPSETAHMARYHLQKQINEHFNK